MSANPGRRTLQFSDLDAVVRDAEHLASVGYDRVGRWDLSQCCGHLAAWMQYAVDGYPRSPLPLRMIMAVIKPTVGRVVLRKTLASGTMGGGVPTLPQTVPPSAPDPGPAIADLRRAVECFKDHEGEYAVSPMFGAMTRDEMTCLQRIHCAHHLSFLLPKLEG